ncbi:MAG: hypothetical protein QT11_C0001G0320 [archaeon GW2011_AR20]|nr:MAG: hypothetical protein QT11_C0001G0320 [archaeon GW2011_AR20]AQS28488.1 hypothetical protein [uncultured archaeon]AQS28598.1 hypothetical protein [uncultured archaeon]MBS3160328.1 hypothetical protein [Candidatus Woesearchaeota archaeon]
MKNLMIKLNELKINNYDRKNNSFILHIVLDVNGEKSFLKRELKLGKYDEIVHDLINFMREHVKTDNKAEDGYDVLGGVVVVRFADDLEELEEKLVKFFKKFNDLVNSFKNRGYSENYLMTYKTVDGFSQRF